MKKNEKRQKKRVGLPKPGKETKTAPEEKLRVVFDSSPDSITVTDLNGNIVDCNQATLRMFGFSAKEQLIGKNGLDLLKPGDRQRGGKQ